jgi:hypothetical protein
MAKAIGSDRVANELRHRIGAERASITADIETYHTKDRPTGGERDLTWHLNHPQSLVQQSLRHHASKIRHLAAELAVLDPETEPVSARDQAREIFAALAAGKRAGDAHWWLAHEWDNFVRADTKRLGEIERSIAWVNEHFQEKGFAESQARLTELLAEQQKRQARLATIGYDAEDYPRKAAAVIEANGGVEHIVGCVRSVWEVMSQWLRPDPTLQAQRDALAEVDAKLARVSDPSSRLVRSLRMERDATAELVEAAEGILTDRRAAQARSLVERAARADEAAVKELTGLAGSVPAAFPEGFDKAFEVLRPNEAQLIGCLEVRLTEE